LVQDNQILLNFLVVQEVLSLHLFLVLLSALLETDQHRQAPLFHLFHQKVLENLWGPVLLVSQEYQEVPKGSLIT
jgi:hypothetical protein